MKERDKYRYEKYVLLIFVKVIYKEFSGLQRYRKKIAVNITKRKALIEQACRAVFPPRLGVLKGRPV